MTPYLSYGCRDKDSRTSQAYLIRSAGGDDFAVLALRIEHPVPYARLGDNDLCTPTHELSNTVFGERRNLLPIRIIDMIPISFL